MAQSIAIALGISALSALLSSGGGGGGRPSVPSVPSTPLSDPVRTQAELDIEARRERVKRARLNQVGTGVGTTPLGLAATGTQRTLPKLTGE